MLRRRLRTIPAVLAATVLVVLVFPVLAPLALAVDVVRAALFGTPFMAIRLLVFGVAYLMATTLGLAAAAWVWATGRRSLIARTYRIQAAWAEGLLTMVERVFGLVFRVEGAEFVQPGPVVVLARHSSIVDNLLPARYIAAPTGIRLRYVMKRELLSDPALDVVGNRLPNVFIDRESETSIDAIAELARNLGPSDGILLFPEGTRFTPAKLARALRGLERRHPRVWDLATGLRWVLPPRTGGAVAAIDASGADVVVLAHRGLDGFARVADVWRGAMVGRTVDIRMWRVAASDIPLGRQGRIAWLFGIWHEIDDWIGRGMIDE